MKRAREVLQWVKKSEMLTGGIAAWDMRGTAYPEVTGYLIPTLYNWGESDLAERCADWLLALQQRCGAFPGIDGINRSFDTAACMEGLQRAWKETQDTKYLKAATKARKWLRTQVMEIGALKIHPRSEFTNIYTMRASALIGSRVGMQYWTPNLAWDLKWEDRERPHYIAYGLDGLWSMGQHEAVVRVLEASTRQPLSSGLFPLYSMGWAESIGTCTTATAQMAILYRRAGMKAEHLLDAVRAMGNGTGGICHGLGDGRCVSWAAKFYLDAIYELETDA